MLGQSLLFMATLNSKWNHHKRQVYLAHCNTICRHQLLFVSALSEYYSIHGALQVGLPVLGQYDPEGFLLI